MILRHYCPELDVNHPFSYLFRGVGGCTRHDLRCAAWHDVMAVRRVDGVGWFVQGGP